MEFGSITMTPHQVLNSSFLTEMQDYITTLQSTKHGDRLPGAGGSAQFSSCSAPLEAMETHIASHPEISKYREICTNGNVTNLNCCSGCGLQFTVGIDLARVGALLELTREEKILGLTTAVDSICSDRLADNDVRCSLEYKSLLILASWTLSRAHKSHTMAMCNNPKLAMSPWLVRTHFGDLYHAVEQKHGPEHMKDFQQHMLQITKLHRHDVVLSHGLSDYVNFPEMAEIAGFVASRDSDYSERLNASRPMPVTAGELRGLAQEMIDNTDKVNKALENRPCGLWGSSNDANSFTAGEWLDGVVEGIDIMSDADSPISKNSFSGVVWKSMGSWRMKKGDSRVYLECRKSHMCLSALSPPFQNAAELGRLVAEQMAEFEGDVNE